MRIWILCLLAASLSGAEWSPALSMKLKTVTGVIPSPDGKSVIWLETKAVIEAEKSEMLTHVHFARIDGSGRRQLTQGDKSANAAEWAPDSKSIFFASDRSGKRNYFRIPVEGGEAEKLTDWKGTLGSFKVSPDGRYLAFTATEEDKDLEKRRKEKLDFRVVGTKPPRQNLWVLDLKEAGAAPKPMLQGAFHVAAFDWSPDGKFVAVDRRSSSEPNESYSADVVEIEISSKLLKTIAATSLYESDPVYSPDGRYIAMQRRQKRSSHDAERITLYTRATGELRDLAATPNDNPTVAGWAPDSKSLVVFEPKGTRSAMYRMPIDGPLQTLYLPQTGVIAGIRMNEKGTHFGFPAQSLDKPVEAFVMAAGGAPVQVSAANSGLELPPVPKSEIIRWKGKDGLDVEGILTYPANYQAGTIVPLILNIHGGPSGVFSESFIGAGGLYPIATFAAKGYAVLRPNPRGSTAYGAAFRNKVDQDWGGLDYQDIQLGVDQVIAMGVANPDKMCVMGWSYGGYMTAWTVTQTTRYRCAAVGAGITNHVSMYGTQDIPMVYEDYFGGPPWEQLAVYQKSSPMNYIQNVKTPTLILHGENDPRVPPTQGYEFRRGLERQKVPVKMIVYPRTLHGPNEPKFTQNIMEQHLDWAAAYLKP
jgi:dipeptidyl aminopeptidase/acylaminoacyl peptidase